MQKWVEILRQNGLLKIIEEPVNIDLEMGYIAYAEVKSEDSKAILFTNPIDNSGKKFPPVLVNTFGSFRALEIIFGRKPDEIANEIERLIKPCKPQSLKEKFDFFSYLFSLRKVFAKRLSARGESQQIINLGKSVDLGALPALKTWQNDGGRFITMGQVFTQSLDGKSQNVGMYRLQIYDKNHLGLHWQIHKDGADFFAEYAKKGVKMPVSIAIGGDPLYIWCAQAPLPRGVFEMLLYGFIRKTPAKLVKSITNDIYIPFDADFIIEGFVDTTQLKAEGPFGDHTGFYTPICDFPLLEVSAITHKTHPIFHATIVGKPPLEDKFMGKATERIFLPLLRTSMPDLIDYNMPENGVFHNLILAKFRAKYPAHALQIAHAFWGVGQMSFVKHAVFVGEDAPNLDDYERICEYVLERISPKSLLISQGVCDELDHASPNACFGGKLAIDASVDNSLPAPEILSDDELLEKLRAIDTQILGLKQYFTHTKNPIVVVNYDKDGLIKDKFLRLLSERKHFKIIIFVDTKVRTQNAYMLVWRVVNNIDALRDIFINGAQIAIDATRKHIWEGYEREWPKEVKCDENVLKSLDERGLISNLNRLQDKFEI